MDAWHSIIPRLDINVNGQRKMQHDMQTRTESGSRRGRSDIEG
jgi:hypothetical protein